MIHSANVSHKLSCTIVQPFISTKILCKCFNPGFQGKVRPRSFPWARIEPVKIRFLGGCIIPEVTRALHPKGKLHGKAFHNAQTMVRVQAVRIDFWILHVSVHVLLYTLRMHIYIYIRIRKLCKVSLFGVLFTQLFYKLAFTWNYLKRFRASDISLKGTRILCFVLRLFHDI